MEISEFVVDTTVAASLPWEETLLMPVGDVQLGAEACDEDRFKRHMEWGMNHNARFLGMGDYVDVASPSNRAKLRSIELYDSVEDALEEAGQKAVERFLKLVKGTEGRWLGMLEGHHYMELRDGTTSDTRIAGALGAPFLGSCAFVRLAFKGNIRKVVSATIWCHHGQGGGQKVSSPLNRLENLMAYFDADIYLMGHQHKKVSAPIDQIYMTRNHPAHLSHRTKIIACTGSFLRGYMEGSKQGAGRAGGTYVEKKMLTPVALGGLVIRLRPVHSGRNDRLDVSVEQ